MTIMGWLVKSLRCTFNHNSGYNVCPSVFIQSREYAARKGTREKARKKKVKKVIEKVGFVIPQKQDLMKKHSVSPLIYINDEWKSEPCDDVWVRKYHRAHVCSFEEAIQNHRETHHPTMLNAPNSIIHAIIGLDMRATKKNKFVDKFSSIAHSPHAFDSGETPSTVLAFSKNSEKQAIAQDAGADAVGGTELIKQIQNGKFNLKDYEYVVADVDILAELLLIRGLLKKKFPNVRMGTLGPDISKLVLKHKQGIKYKVGPVDEKHKDYGETTVAFGLLDMDMKMLKENLSTVVNDIEKRKPAPNRSFIQKVDVISKISREYFKINFKEFFPLEKVEAVEDEEQDDTGIISTQ